MFHPLQSHYDKIPAVKCKGLCQETCGPIFLSQVEVDEVKAKYGVKLGTDDKMSCTALCGVTGACKVYDARPWVCRAYGAMTGLECPYGCNTAPLVSIEDADTLLHDLEKVGGRISCTMW
jgi:Fe-S-cluster containining protein